MALEKWVAIASIGLYVMFVGEIISVFNFIINMPANFEFGTSFEPSPKILQFISIGVAPACVLSGLAFLLSKRYGSKQIGSMILSGGIILLIGMAYCYSLLDKIPDSYMVDAVVITPPLFMGVSIPVIIVGLILIKTNKKRPKKEYF
ncbi:hypothetical protein [Nitrosarchaeum koreense]|uniref:Uncharacterized protein n=1 Tax=Nitrosarchaeum koreense MY1 TaxID=1001994 RepID=F9CVJ0_9ARCH|nr:hypothetical protein [Nitrosarchaeum koreense]EGP93292.1 hypothetical protein MY1_0526 [Nitrosarchaeum koreense MY1]